MDAVGSGLTLLERPVYAEAEAARLLGVPQRTLHYWIEGGQRGQRHYQPVLRPEATGQRVLTWGEFVEAFLLRNYRKQNIPMRELRVFIQSLRRELGVPYPLAHARPWFSGRQLLFHAQADSDLPQEFWLVSNAQGLFTFPGHMFFDQVNWGGPPEQVVVSVRPDGIAHPNSPVVIDPLVRFGRPSIRGISTTAIFDEMNAGASFEEVADDFDLSESDVKWAMAYESGAAA